MSATPGIAKVALHNFIPRNSDIRRYKLITEFMTYLLHWHFCLSFTFKILPSLSQPEIYGFVVVFISFLSFLLSSSWCIVY